MSEIDIKLSNDEALVLFEFLTRFSETDVLQIENQAEARVLWDIHCDLEKILVEPFQSNYSELLKKAQSNVLDKE